MELNLEVFFFNAKTDYLPYYKDFKINIDENEPIKTLLEEIKKQNRNFNYPDNNLWLRVNSKVLNQDTKISAIVKKFGTNLVIEPAFAYRSKDCLILDDSDFYNNYKKFEHLCDEEDKNYYNSLYGLHYASETLNYNKNYIGDSALIFAFYLIRKDDSNRDEVLSIISQENGLWDAEFENNMFDETIDYTSLFNLLKQEAGPVEDNNKVCSLFTRKYKDRKLTDDEIGVAYYGKNPDIKLKENQKFINFEYQNKKCGKDLLDTNEKMALFKAGRVLSDAFDSGADILVVEKDDVLDYFKSNIGKIERVINRELPINLVSKSSF